MQEDTIRLLYLNEPTEKNQTRKLSLSPLKQLYASPSFRLRVCTLPYLKSECFFASCWKGLENMVSHRFPCFIVFFYFVGHFSNLYSGTSMRKFALPRIEINDCLLLILFLVRDVCCDVQDTLSVYFRHCDKRQFWRGELQRLLTIVKS